MIADPICDILVADASIIALTATYDFGAGEAPAIFDFEPAPESSPNPVITVTEAGGTGIEGARDTRGWRQFATISIWGNKNHSRAALRDLGLNVLRAIDRTNLTLRSPYCEVGCWAGPMQETTDGEGFPGIIIPVQVLVLEGSGPLV